MSTPGFYHHLVSDEYPRFRKVIAAVPPDNLEWQPDPKARTARALIGHLIGHNQDLVELLDDGIVHHRMQVEFDTLTDALDLFDQSHNEMHSKLGALDEASWEKPAEFLVGEEVAWAASVQEIMWGMLLDSIHHRGQLSTYLRPMGGKVPAIYGPSADDDGQSG